MMIWWHANDPAKSVGTARLLLRAESMRGLYLYGSMPGVELLLAAYGSGHRVRGWDKSSWDPVYKVLYSSNGSVCRSRSN
jgi:hypothetical protein